LMTVRALTLALLGEQQRFTRHENRRGNAGRRALPKQIRFGGICDDLDAS